MESQPWARLPPDRHRLGDAVELRRDDPADDPTRVVASLWWRAQDTRRRRMHGDPLADLAAGARRHPCLWRARSAGLRILRLGSRGSPCAGRACPLTAPRPPFT